MRQQPWRLIDAERLTNVELLEADAPVIFDSFPMAHMPARE